MDNRQISQSSETTARDIGARDTTADDSEEDETIDDMGKPHQTSPFNGNDEGTSQGATSADEVLVVIRYTHSDEPYINHKEGGHSPKYRVDGAADRLSWLHGLTGNDSNMLTYQNVSSSETDNDDRCYYSPPPKLKRAWTNALAMPLIPLLNAPGFFQ